MPLRRLLAAVLVSLVLPYFAVAEPLTQLVIFGDSLSDLVNNAVIFGAGRDPGSYLSLVTRAQRPSVAFQGNTLPTEPALPGGLHTFFPPQPRWSESTSIRTKVAVGSAPT